MRISHAVRLLVLCGLISALLSAVPAMAAMQAYMTIKGVKQGHIRSDSTSENIRLVSVTHDAATGMASGKRMHTPVTVTKLIDAASPKLFAAFSSHETLSEVAIVFSKSGSQGQMVVVEKIVMNNATIVSIRKAGANEMITFDYQTIEVTWNDGGKTATDDWEAPK